MEKLKMLLRRKVLRLPVGFWIFFACILIELLWVWVYVTSQPRGPNVTVASTVMYSLMPLGILGAAIQMLVEDPNRKRDFVKSDWQTGKILIEGFTISEIYLIAGTAMFGIFFSGYLPNTILFAFITVRFAAMVTIFTIGLGTAYWLKIRREKERDEQVSAKTNQKK